MQWGHYEYLSYKIIVRKTCVEVGRRWEQSLGHCEPPVNATCIVKPVMDRLGWEGKDAEADYLKCEGNHPRENKRWVGVYPGAWCPDEKEWQKQRKKTGDTVRQGLARHCHVRLYTWGKHSESHIRHIKSWSWILGHSEVLPENSVNCFRHC